jgi:hypothetical protein
MTDAGTDEGVYADRCPHCGGNKFAIAIDGFTVLEMPDGRIIGGLRRCTNRASGVGPVGQRHPDPLLPQIADILTHEAERKAAGADRRSPLCATIAAHAPRQLRSKQARAGSRIAGMNGPRVGARVCSTAGQSARRSGWRKSGRRPAASNRRYRDAAWRTQTTATTPGISGTKNTPNRQTTAVGVVSPTHQLGRTANRCTLARHLLMNGPCDVWAMLPKLAFALMSISNAYPGQPQLPRICDD